MEDFVSVEIPDSHLEQVVVLSGDMVHFFDGRDQGDAALERLYVSPRVTLEVYAHENDAPLFQESWVNHGAVTLDGTTRFQ